VQRGKIPRPQRPIKPLARALIRWFGAKARPLPWRRTADPYAIWVAEIMLQQTQVKTVIPYWERWMRALPDIRALAKARPQTVLKLWEGLGYYSRGRNLHRAAQMLSARDIRVEGISWSINSCSGTRESAAEMRLSYESRYSQKSNHITEYTDKDILIPLCTIRHSVTRYRIHLEAYYLKVIHLPAKTRCAGRWVTWAELKRLPFVSAHRKVLESMKR
jgi:adenine-specific DNA glycosylase